MKVTKILLYTFFILCITAMNWFLGTTGSPAAEEQKKLRLAVIGFEKTGEEISHLDLNKIVNEWLTAFLVNTNVFEVIERQALEKVLQEQSLGQSGIIDPESAARAGKLLGVNILVTGTLMYFAEELEVTVRLIDTSNGTIVGVVSVSTKDENELRAKIERLAHLIRKKLSPTSLEKEVKVLETFDGDTLSTDRWIVWFDEGVKEIDKKNTEFSQHNGVLRVEGKYRQKDDDRIVWLVPASGEHYNFIETKMRVREVKEEMAVCLGMIWNKEESWTGLCAYVEEHYGDLVVNLEDTESTFDLNPRLGQRHIMRLGYKNGQFHYYWDEQLVKSLTPKTPVAPSERLLLGVFLALEGTKKMRVEFDEIMLW